MRIFPDANVLVAALLWEKGLCSKILHAILDEQKHLLILSDWVWEETAATLQNDFGVPSAHLTDYRRRLTAHGKIQQQQTPLALAPYPVADPDDKVVLSCALIARADVLVTGDNALLDVAAQVKRAEQVLIMTPAKFWTCKGELW